MNTIRGGEPIRFGIKVYENEKGVVNNEVKIKIYKGDRVVLVIRTLAITLFSFGVALLFASIREDWEASLKGERQLPSSSALTEKVTELAQNSLSDTDLPQFPKERSIEPQEIIVSLQQKGIFPTKESKEQVKLKDVAPVVVPVKSFENEENLQTHEAFKKRALENEKANEEMTKRWLQKFTRFTLAAEKGDLDAKYDLALMLLNEKPVEHETTEDFKEAKQYLKEAAHQGHVHSCNKLIELYIREGKREKQLYYYEKLADLGNPSDQLHVGDMYRGEILWNQVDCINKRKHAEKFFLMAAENERASNVLKARSYHLLADMYLGSTFGDHKKALEYAKKAAALDPNNSPVHLMVALLYRSVGNSEKSKKWLKDAVELLTKKAEENDHDAQHLLAYCYRYGDGVEKDVEKANFWDSKATGWINLAFKPQNTSKK